MTPTDWPTDWPMHEQVPDTISLHFRQVVYRYAQGGVEAPFSLGPLSFTLHRPSITFITGGNGSGKSTLVKLLCGLYVPNEGQVMLNDIAIDRHNREAYRQLFSVVFFDFFLFDSLLGLESQALDHIANPYLQRLRLDRQVTVQNGIFSTTALSQGQRRRLALLASYLEDRLIYVFDEWAADQDATFKTIFYQEFIPELKQKGKIVIVVSHDDSYFHVADRVLKL